MRNWPYLNLPIAHHGLLLWLIAIFLTGSSAVYQRWTGPTHPMRGRVTFQGQDISFKLLRSEVVHKDAPVELRLPDETVSGYVLYRRYKSHDPWTRLPLQRENDTLKAYLPHQPAAGKITYFVYLEKDDLKISLTGSEPVILRYKGYVPAAILIPHIFFMFAAMLFSNRAGLEALDARGQTYPYMVSAIALFFIGGFIFGPLMQKFAFGNYWTGFPYGFDLTDNKTLIAMMGWVIAWIANGKGANRRGWILFAAILMLVIYLIPHSLLGSELDYTKLTSSS